jgi:anti-sigma B factor antagonist
MEDLLRTEKEQHDGRVAIALIGELDLSNAAELIGEFAETVAGQPTAVDVDLSELTYSDSVGLTALATAHFQCIECGIPLRILNPNRFIERLLDITGLDELLRIVQSGDAYVGC